MEATAGALISARVVVGGAEDRLADLYEKIRLAGATHCSVVEGQTFVGLIRLSEVCRFAQPGLRILADLIAEVSPMMIKSSEAAEGVSTLFRQHQLFEAVVVDAGGDYVGLATSESVLSWALNHLQKQERLLVDCQRQLSVAAGARDAFIRSISHELRTPLNPVLMVASDGASNSGYPPEVREQFQLISIHALLEAQLIDKLLETGRSQRDDVRLELETADLRTILHSSISAIHQAHPSWNIALNDHSSAGRILIRADVEKLGQAFRNIIHYLFQGIKTPPTLDVNVSPAVESSRVSLEFRRPGSGLTRVQLARAFETGEGQPGKPLSRAEHLSLGLSFAQAVVALHAGYLDVDSQGPEKGIRIEVALPLASQV